MPCTATKTLTLYQYEACPFCWKVKAALDYKGLSYDVVEVHPLNKKEISFSEEYKKVPILVSDGQQLNGSTEILPFLDQAFPNNPLFENAPVAQAAEKKWLEWADDVLVHALPPVIYATYGKALKAFGYITKVGKFSWLQSRLIKYSGALAMTIVARKGAKKRKITEPIPHFTRCLKEWEQAVGSEGVLGQKGPNAADVAVYGYLKAIQSLPAFSIVKENQRVYQWFGAMEEVCRGK